MAEATPAAPVVETEVGSYFVANYPPFSVWNREAVDRDALPALHTAPAAVPLGLYLHIPFCRKRCHFCYFRVYTQKNAQEVAEYLDLLVSEWEIYGHLPAIAGRPLGFVYFGGGTPSFLSTAQLEGLVERLAAVAPWSKAEEITFECEPGTLTEGKLSAIRRMGVTRLSLGVENFDTWETYGGAIGRGEIPLARAYRPSHEERMIRELVLQLKRGSIRPAYFKEKYEVDLRKRFEAQLSSLAADGYLGEANDDVVALSREGLLRVDVLLRRFFLPEHTGIRYT